jgi:hypothetical protein
MKKSLLGPRKRPYAVHRELTPRENTSGRSNGSTTSSKSCAEHQRCGKCRLLSYVRAEAARQGHAYALRGHDGGGRRRFRRERKDRPHPLRLFDGAVRMHGEQFCLNRRPIAPRRGRRSRQRREGAMIMSMRLRVGCLLDRGRTHDARLRARDCCWLGPELDEVAVFANVVGDEGSVKDPHERRQRDDHCDPGCEQRAPVIAPGSPVFRESLSRIGHHSAL